MKHCFPATICVRVCTNLIHSHSSTSSWYTTIISSSFHSPSIPTARNRSAVPSVLSAGDFSGIHSVALPVSPAVVRGDQQPLDDGSSMEFIDEEDTPAVGIGEPHPLQHIGMINNHINYNKYNSIFYPPGMTGRPVMKDSSSGWLPGRRYPMVAKGNAPRYRHQQPLHHDHVHRYQGLTS